MSESTQERKHIPGLGSLFRRGRVWWIAFYHRGKERRESSHSGKESAALKLLRKRVGEITAGRFIPREDKLTFEDLAKDLENDYRINGKRSLITAQYYIRHLRGFFASNRAIDITSDRVRAYQNYRLKEGASNATANREVAILGRMLSLAYSAGKLSRRPRFGMLQENNVRQGFLEHGDFLRLLDTLPAYLKPLVEFLYLSGWRKGEALNLEWKDVDLEGRVVRLRIEHSKNKESRVLPLTGRLWEVARERLRERRPNCPFVFHFDGHKVGDFRKAWQSACVAAGLGQFVEHTPISAEQNAPVKAGTDQVEEKPGRATAKSDVEARKKGGYRRYVGTIPHDLRRCAARNLSRAGVTEQVAMGITGHKTNSMYRRYRIVDERDLREATARLQAHLRKQFRASVAVLKRDTERRTA